MKFLPGKIGSALLLAGVLLVFTALAQPPPAREGEGAVAPPLSAEQIIQKLIEQNQRRDALLAGWEVRRRYYLSNEIYEKEVERIVQVTFRVPDNLEFNTIREKGSGFLADRVFGRMMEGEQEALEAENKRRSAMRPENYRFKLVGNQVLDGRPAYILEITPKREDTFLFEGKVWVDAQDFAVVRAQGKPAKRPSFWTRDIDFVRTFKKVGPFWLPDRTESVTEVWLFGTSWTTMENGDYKVRLQPGASGAR